MAICAANDPGAPMRLPSRLAGHRNDDLDAVRGAARFDAAARALSLFAERRTEVGGRIAPPVPREQPRDLKEISIPAKWDVRRRVPRRDGLSGSEGTISFLCGQWTWADGNLVFQLDALGGNRFEFYPVSYIDRETGRRTNFQKAHGTYAGVVSGGRLSGMYTVETGIYPYRTAFSGEISPGGRRLMLRKREPVCLPLLRGGESQLIFHRI